MTLQIYYYIYLLWLYFLLSHTPLMTLLPTVTYTSYDLTSYRYIYLLWLYFLLLHISPMTLQISLSPTCRNYALQCSIAWNISFLFHWASMSWHTDLSFAKLKASQLLISSTSVGRSIIVVVVGRSSSNVSIGFNKSEVWASITYFIFAKGEAER